MKSIIVAIAAVLSAIYLLNPTAGLDIIPDFIPFVGNLDEATAMAVLLACMRYFGYDLAGFFGNKSTEKTPDLRTAKGREVDTE